MADPYPNVEFVNDQEREYFEEARLGILFEKFLSSEVGRYLHGCAKQEVLEAKDAIYLLNPYDPNHQKEMIRLQIQSAAGESFMRWCAEAIQKGRLAEQQLEEYE